MHNRIKIKFKSLKSKLLLYVFSTTTVILILTIGYINIKTTASTLHVTELYIKQTAQSYANEIKSTLTSDFSMVKGLADGFATVTTYSQPIRDSITKSVQKGIISENHHVISMWLNWELSHIDSITQFGRVRYNYIRHNNSIIFKIDTLDLSGDNTSSLYYAIKKSKRNTITEPYFYSYTGDKENEVHEVSVCSPIISNGKYIGLVGIDRSLASFDEFVQRIKPYENSYAFLVSNQGIVVSHIDNQLIGKNITEAYGDTQYQNNIKLSISSGKQYSFYDQTNRKDKKYVCLTPIFVGDTQSPWSIAIVVPQKIMIARATDIRISTIVISLIGFLILFFAINKLAVNLSTPLIKASQTIEKIARGEIDKSTTINVDSKDEIGLINRSLVLLTDGMDRMAKFAKDIGSGNLTSEYKLLGQNDIMGLSLIEMQKNLQKAKDEELNHRKEEEIKSWINQGMTGLNELLREQNLDFQQLMYQTVKLIVDHIEANQGVMFMKQDLDTNIQDSEQDEFIAVSALAWGRKRSIKKSYKMGESLVGRCAFEKSTIYLTQVPQNYVNITSGLGKANPNYMLLTPLKSNDVVLGVIEIASFSAIEQHEIDFIEKACDGIAATIGNKQAGEQTAKLLEQTKQQAEELSQKEEEMRQNMEELLATQEDFARREKEIGSMVEAVNSLVCVYHFDLSGRIIYANSNFCNFLRMSKETIIGNDIYSLSGQSFGYDEITESDFVERAFDGDTIRQTKIYNIEGEERKLIEVHSPVKGEEGVPVKIICVAIETT